MKIAISSQGTDLNATVDPRFGRARCFLVYDTETNEVALVDNASSANAMQGAGVQTAQVIAAKGVGAVLSGHVGPKAFTALRAAGIDVYVGVAGTVRDAVEAFRAGQLTAAATADVQGH
ncbi:MAG: NifB/NifX family molybdenum-iron cluster-binding protein [Verrucomicrobiia bacterium]